MRDDRVVFASQTISVLHYDDLAGMRALVRHALADDARINLLASASTADELLEQVAEFSPDVVVARFPYEKLVYDSPWPKGNSGSIFLASKCR